MPVPDGKYVIFSSEYPGENIAIKNVGARIEVVEEKICAGINVVFL